MKRLITLSILAPMLFSCSMNQGGSNDVNKSYSIADIYGFSFTLDELASLTIEKDNIGVAPEYVLQYRYTSKDSRDLEKNFNFFINEKVHSIANPMLCGGYKLIVTYTLKNGKENSIIIENDHLFLEKEDSTFSYFSFDNPDIVFPTIDYPEGQ